MDGRAVIRHITWKKNVLVQVRYLIQFLRKSDFEEMVVNSIHQVCHMKMAVHYAVMVRCKLKRNYGFTGSRVRLKPDGTRWRTGGEVKGKLANGVGANTLTLPRNMVYKALLTLMHTTRLPAVDWTDAPADLNGLIRFGERQILVCVRVPSHFKSTLLPVGFLWGEKV